MERKINPGILLARQITKRDLKTLDFVLKQNKFDQIIEKIDTLSNINTEKYTLALISEEASEVAKEASKSIRFGLNSPSNSDGTSAKKKLLNEIGDFLAAIQYALKRNIITDEDIEYINKVETEKLKKLLDPESKDNLGRRLAP